MAPSGGTISNGCVRVKPLSGLFLTFGSGVRPQDFGRDRTDSGGRSVNALSFHSLRHTFNSILANAGVPEETRMALTGHTTRAMNQVYTHRQLQTYVDAVAMVPRVSLT